MNSSLADRARSLRREPDQFAIEISFEAHTDAPARIFRSISALIEAFEFADGILIQTIAPSIRPLLLLEDVEAGSVRVWLKNKLESVDDSILASGDYKKVIGAFLVKGKKILIDYCSHTTTIQSLGDIAEIQAQIVSAATETGVHAFPAYQPPPRALLANSIQMIADSTRGLTETDSAKFLSAYGDSDLNLSFSVTPEAIEELLVKESMTHEEPMILRIKKPDFLGESMWDFQFGRRVIPARMDAKWLGEFRNGQHNIKPGDALRAIVRTTHRYGFDADVVSSHYEIVQVLEVIKAPSSWQPTLPL